MASESDIVAAAQADSPELLDLETLDSITGGTEYGGTNTCEPTRRPSGHGKWIEVLSVSTHSFERVTGVNGITSK